MTTQSKKRPMITYTNGQCLVIKKETMLTANQMLQFGDRWKMMESGVS